MTTPRLLTRANLRLALAALRGVRRGPVPVYDSLGADFFLSPAPGWLNLGLWDGPGDEAEAAVAPRRLVETLARALPRGGDVLDAGNGLGAQDPVIAAVAAPGRFVAINVTESQLRAGRRRLDEAGARPVLADATRIPLADGSVDGVISVEAAFHFRSRREFFAEARRVLRAGGVLVMSDVSAERTIPRTPAELFAGLVNLRVWGLRARDQWSRARIEGELRDAGFVDVGVEVVSDRVLRPALRFLRARIAARRDVPRAYRTGARLVLWTWTVLWRGRAIEYLLVRASVPGA